MRQLPTITAVLYTADGDARIRRGNAIDEHAARVEITGNPASKLDILGPKVATKTKLACIRRAHCRVNIRNPSYRRNGTERLVVESRHAFCHSPQHGRRVKRALAFDAFASAQEAGALCDGSFDLFV